MTSVLGSVRSTTIDLYPFTLQTIPESIAKNIAIVRTRSRAQIMAVVKKDGYGHGALSVAHSSVAAGAQWLGTTDFNETRDSTADKSSHTVRDCFPTWKCSLARMKRLTD